MKLFSIQVGKPQTYQFNGQEVTTSIFKDKIPGPVLVSKTNIEGDEQADLRVHGGEEKAVYAYSLDAYEDWERIYGKKFPAGTMGENLTIDSFHEEDMGIGDIYQLGECQLQIVQPRIPCYKLAVRLNDIASIKVFNEVNRCGIYFRVLKEGKINTGDEFKLIEKEKNFVSVHELFKITLQTPDLKKLEPALNIENLNPSWRKKIENLKWP